MSSVFGALGYEGLGALAGTCKEKGATMKEYQLSFGASVCSFGCAASGDVQKQKLQLEKFHAAILAMSEASRSLCAVDIISGGLWTPHQVEKIEKIYSHMSSGRICAHLNSQAEEHLQEEIMTLVWAALPGVQVLMGSVAILLRQLMLKAWYTLTPSPNTLCRELQLYEGI